jgi:hypothetical protein
VRFEDLNAFTPAAPQTERRAVELELGASHDLTGIPLDLSIAQRASFGANDAGDLTHRSRGAEVRIGRALGDPQGNMSDADSRVYMFAASSDQALTWSPGDDARQWGYDSDRVRIGDRQAGVTYERGPMQASFAYVERKISSTVGVTTHSDTESFTGLTLTMRR